MNNDPLNTVNNARTRPSANKLRVLRLDPPLNETHPLRQKTNSVGYSHPPTDEADTPSSFAFTSAKVSLTVIVCTSLRSC
jgi:hypothetical protein